MPVWIFFYGLPLVCCLLVRCFFFFLSSLFLFLVFFLRCAICSTVVLMAWIFAPGPPQMETPLSHATLGARHLSYFLNNSTQQIDFVICAKPGRCVREANIASHLKRFIDLLDLEQSFHLTFLTDNFTPGNFTWTAAYVCFSFF